MSITSMNPPCFFSGSYSRIYAVIKRIPRGRVATFGQVAALAELGKQARQVGYALAATPENLKIPWHRVINARGEISGRSEPGDSVPGEEDEQRGLLEAEGIEFDDRARVSLGKYRWRPRVS